jgi:drug/metabolite transporter (DMT)-like permease
VVVPALPGYRARVTFDHFLFLLMSLIWGTTWIAAKAGITAVPPIFFGAARYVLVSAVLLAAMRGLRAVFAGGRAMRVIVGGLFINVGTYAFLFWGMQFVASGVAGVINMSMMPVGLFGLAILLRQEQPTWRHAVALLLGIAGLAALFSSKASFTGDDMELWGVAAILASTLSYCIGSVLSRPLLDAVSPLRLTAAHALVGAAGLGVLSLALEPVSAATFAALMQPAPLAGLLFMVIAGTFFAYTIYLRLVREWGAPRAGLYAFVSPVAALILGTLVFGEPLTWREAAGAAIMLVAAALAMRPRAGPPP